MLVELTNNLQSMYDQIMSNLYSNNLRSGINLFSVPGFIRQGNSYKTTTTIAITDIKIEPVEGTDYTFTLNANGYYQSNNADIHNSVALCKLSFTAHGATELALECINYTANEANYDYGILSNLDTTLTTTTSDSASTIYHTFKGNSSTDVQTIYYDVPIGEHFIYIKFRKDSVYSEGNDNLQFKVGEIGNVVSLGDEVTASAYFTKEDLIADNTQPDNTVGIVMDINGNMSLMYQRINGTWQQIFDYSTRVQMFATIEEMNQHTTLPENTIAIVYGTSYVGTYKLDSGVWTPLGDANDEVLIMNTLNEVDGIEEEYEGPGGTDEEINQVLNTIIGGNE